MVNNILNYQKASQKLLNTLKNNNKVLAVFASGSIVNGDIWEGSDIDIFVIYKDKFNEVRHIYSEILDIPVHMKIVKKEKFIEMYNNYKKRGKMRNLLISSKLLFCRDDEIGVVSQKARYSMDEYIEIWNLVYLGNLIKSLGVVKKYLYNNGTITAYEVLIKSLDNFSKLYLNLNNYTVIKDSINMTMNLNNEFNTLVRDLFENECNELNINSVIDYLQFYIDNNISIASKCILEYMYEEKIFLSSNDIKKSYPFAKFDIKMELILKELYKRGLIIKDERKLDLDLNEKLMSENVYCYR